ncbi:MAG: hypothetical protein M0C28_17585 [Candidatus Moduliflexus flocculans]|nr:hypothetical protein [Candidatus Moduliflexus flocculans]
MLTGQQEKFSWTGVAIGALSAAASYGIDKAFNLDPKQELGQFKSFDPSLEGRNFDPIHFAKNLGAELTKSAARQAITIAVNKDGKMDWTPVAADGLGNAIGNAIVDQMKYNASAEKWAEQQFADWDRDMAGRSSVSEGDRWAQKEFDGWDA